MASLTPLFLNRAYGTVQAGSSAIGSASATGVNVASGEGAQFGTISTDQYIPAVIVDTSTNPETVKEYVWITARSTDALTVVRQAEDSSRFAASTSTIQAGYVIAAVSTGDALSRTWGGGETAGDRGFLLWSFPPWAIASTDAPLTGRLVVQRVAVHRAIAVSNIAVFVASAGGTLTAGQNFAGLYDTSGAKLATTGDQSAVWNSTGLATMAITGAPITISPPWVWVVILANGTSAPSLSSSATGVGSGVANLGATVSTSFHGRVLTGQTTLPASFTPSSLTQQAGGFWVALS